MESSSPRSSLRPTATVNHKHSQKIAIVGAGWAGLSAAICATQAGHQVTLFEASRHWGGRARSLAVQGKNEWMLDNGQHILIGAYHQSLRLMKSVGVQENLALWRLPLQLIKPDGTGLVLKNLPFPLNLLWGIAPTQIQRSVQREVRRSAQALAAVAAARPRQIAVGDIDEKSDRRRFGIGVWQRRSFLRLLSPALPHVADGSQA